ncbi:hypothetical protein ABBQ32_011620 [Trebouxia sp. C0010 RCD-2024]
MRKGATEQLKQSRLQCSAGKLSQVQRSVKGSDDWLTDSGRRHAESSKASKQTEESLEKPEKIHNLQALFMHQKGHIRGWRRSPSPGRR